jgi:hypothetical protein
MDNCQKVTVSVPEAVGPRSNISPDKTRDRRVNRGNATERNALLIAETLREQEEKGGTEGELAHERLEKWRIVNDDASRKDMKQTLPATLKAVGREVHLPNSPMKKVMKRIANNKQSGRVVPRSEPVVRPLKMSDREMHARTGFQNELMLLAYIVIVCNGNGDRMTETCSSLTWYEEWFLFFEYKYQRTLSSLSSATSIYGINTNIVAPRVVITKLDFVLAARKSWPTYVSLDEDRFFRDKKWNTRYQGKRPVFWDNTGLGMLKVSDALLQSLTYSQYYAGNVAKGGIFVQLCGWMGTHDLYPGAMSDTKYFKETGILEQQKLFQEMDGGAIKFLNVLDRGYRVTRAAWKQNQFVLQPNFASSDRKFNTLETLRSAALAADRSGNERCVRLAKSSNLVKYGLQKQGGTSPANIQRVSKSWLAHGFQVNFMYQSVM